MDNQTAVLVSKIVEGVIGLAIAYATPYAIDMFKAVREKSKTITGANNFAYAKDFIENEYTLHADLFSEDNVITLLDSLDDKFGDRLSHETIKKLVDLVLVSIKATYTTSSAEEARVIKESEVKPVEKVAEAAPIATVDVDKITDGTLSTK